MRDYTVKLSYSGGIMANRDTSRVSGNTRRGILYISRRKHFENYILFQHAHRICMIIVLIHSISAILNSQNWSVVRIVSSHTVPNFWPCQRHEYPEPGSNTKFKNYERTQTVPFVIDADFECYIEGLDTVEQNPHKSSTTQYQKHNPSGFCYYIKCFDNSIYKSKLVHYTQQYEGEDITKKFVDLLEEEVHNIANYRNATKCYVRNEGFTPEN